MFGPYTPTLLALLTRRGFLKLTARPFPADGVKGATAVVTCVLVMLPTIGASTAKSIQRIAGAVELGRVGAEAYRHQLVRFGRNGDFVRAQINAHNVTACHDIADAGLLVALAEMALASNRGIKIDTDNNCPNPLFTWLFGEDQGRYLIATEKPNELLTWT